MIEKIVLVILLLGLVGCHKPRSESGTATYDVQIEECEATDMWIKSRGGLWRRVYDCGEPE